MFSNYNSNNGFGLLEIVLAIALISGSLFALTAVSQVAFRATEEASDRVRASFLLEEGFEALKLIRDDSWINISSLNNDQTYYLIFSGGSWQTTSSPEIIEGLFTRSFVSKEVLRDGAYNIASSGTSDGEIRKVEMSIIWDQRGVAREIKGTTYLANIFLE